MTRHPKYKTEQCKTFHTMGLCPYGHRCHFIHNETIVVSTEDLILFLLFKLMAAIRFALLDPLNVSLQVS